MSWYFFRWLRGPANIAQGLAQTLSLGFWDPGWALAAEGRFLDECEKNFGGAP